MVSALELIADQIKSRARAELAREGMTRTALARAAGLHENTLIGMEGDGWKPSLKTLNKLEAYLNAPTQAAA
jgi:3,4-dihydroxy 2-butanone 4-phosphate synthase/GTP cyclohydrolase II